MCSVKKWKVQKLKENKALWFQNKGQYTVRLNNAGNVLTLLINDICAVKDVFDCIRFF